MHIYYHMSLSGFMGAMTTICGVDEGFERIFCDDLIKAKAKDQQKYRQTASRSSYKPSAESDYDCIRS